MHLMVFEIVQKGKLQKLTEQSKIVSRTKLFFETAHLKNGKIALLNYHIQRIYNTFKYFEFDTDKTAFAVSLKEELSQIAKTNASGNGSARLKMQFYLNPYDRKYALAFEIQALSESFLNPDYVVDEIGLYHKISIKNRQSNGLKLNHVEPFETIWKKAANQGLFLLKNTSNDWVDSSIGNIFYLLDGMWFTPAKNSGCINGVMQAFIFAHTHQLSLKVCERNLKNSDLPKLEALAFTNAVRGFVPVKQLMGYNPFQNLTEAKRLRKLVMEML